MKTATKSSLITIVLAAALALLLFPDAFAEAGVKSATAAVKEQGVSTETVSSDRMPKASDGLAPASKPFEKPGERVPAASAVVGESKDSGPDVVNYATTVVRETPSELILNATISKMEEDAVLSRLADKIYREKSGNKYDNVTILWHLGSNPEPAAPFARTDVQKSAPAFEIIKTDKK